MKETQYVALLRGINVGGNNIIKMEKLKGSFEGMKLKNVATFIQSGNVLFQSSERDAAKLVSKIEKVLSRTFSYKSRVVVISHDQLKHAIKLAPRGFGKNPVAYKCDVIFLKPPLSAAAVIKTISVKPGVDTAAAGKGVLYFSHLIAKASQSHLSRIVQLPMYPNITIRNWNTTTKLLALMDARAV